MDLEEPGTIQLLLVEVASDYFGSVRVGSQGMSAGRLGMAFAELLPHLAEGLVGPAEFQAGRNGDQRFAGFDSEDAGIDQVAMLLGQLAANDWTRDLCSRGLEIWIGLVSAPSSRRIGNAPMRGLEVWVGLASTLVVFA